MREITKKVYKKIIDFNCIYCKSEWKTDEWNVFTSHDIEKYYAGAISQCPLGCGDTGYKKANREWEDLFQLNKPYAKEN